mgnify:CR=1 FL=1
MGVRIVNKKEVGKKSGRKVETGIKTPEGYFYIQSGAYKTLINKLMCCHSWILVTTLNKPFVSAKKVGSNEIMILKEKGD